MTDDQKKILEHYGAKVEILKTCEECAELIQALLKGKPSDIISEIADVEICLDYVKTAFGIPEDILQSVKDYKLKRQMERMKHE